MNARHSKRNERRGDCDAVSGVRQFERLNRAVDEADLEVPISDAYELADAAKSHERLAKARALRARRLICSYSL